MQHPLTLKKEHIYTVTTSHLVQQKSLNTTNIWYNPNLPEDLSAELVAKYSTNMPLNSAAALLNASTDTLLTVAQSLQTVNNDRIKPVPVDVLTHTLYQRLGPIPEVQQLMFSNAASPRRNVWSLDERIPAIKRSSLNPLPNITHIYNAAHNIEPYDHSKASEELASWRKDSSSGFKKARIPTLIRLLAVHDPDSAIKLASLDTQFYPPLLASNAVNHIDPQMYLTAINKYTSNVSDFKLLVERNAYRLLVQPVDDSDQLYDALFKQSFHQLSPTVLPAALTKVSPSPATVTRLYNLVVKADAVSTVDNKQTVPFTFADRFQIASILLNEHSSVLSSDQLNVLSAFISTGTSSMLTADEIDVRVLFSSANLYTPQTCETCNVSFVECQRSQLTFLDKHLTSAQDWDSCFMLLDTFTGSVQDLVTTINALQTRTISTRSLSPRTGNSAAVRSF